MRDETTKGYKSLGGDDSLRHVPQVLDSIKSGGAGNPDEIQCLVQNKAGLNFRIKDIVFDNKQRCVKLHIDETEPITKPDYTPDEGNDKMLFKQKR